MAQNELLTEGKLLLLLERYLGESIQLPARVGVNDTVYGSLTMYRQEVVEHLARWAANHSLEALQGVLLSVHGCYLIL